MSSRADFLRSMGISNEDMVNPDDQAGAAPPAPPARSSRAGGSLVMNREMADPSIQSTSNKSAFTGSPLKKKFSSSGGFSNTTKGAYSPSTTGTTSAILSMRDSDDDDDEVYRAPPQRQAPGRNATGSQEISAAPTGAASTTGYSHSSYSSSSTAPPPPARATPTYNTSASYTSSNSGNFDAPTQFDGAKAEGAKMTRAEKAKEADAQKLEGNSFFQQQEYRKAVRCYSKAIEMDPSNAALYSNRSAAYLAGSKQMGIDTRNMALRDAGKAIELRPDWAKGYCRRGEALMELESYEEAVEAWQQALEYDPQNPNFEARLAEAEEKCPRKSAISSSVSMGPRRTSAGVRGTKSGEYSSSTGESARVMAAQFYEKTDLSGQDFRSQELEKLRSRRSGNSFTSTTSTTSGGESRPVGGVSGVGSSGYFSAARSVPEEFSSGAARNYQASLLEAYRKKKQGGQ